MMYKYFKYNYQSSYQSSEEVYVIATELMISLTHCKTAKECD